MLNQFQLFDSHLHIIDKRFPLIENNGYLPDEFTSTQYLARMLPYDLCGGVIVSGSFQSFDQTYLIDALNTLGDSFVGVTQISSSVSDGEIFRLNDFGVRAVRFNLKRGGSEDIKHLQSMASRINELVGWHIELYIDSTIIPDLQDIIIKLPRVSIDHLGLNKNGFKHLLLLAEKNIKIKATGFGRIDFSVMNALKELYSINPTSLMFGTDLPSTRAARAYTDDDFMLVIKSLGDDAAKKVFSQNAIDFYKPKALRYE